jgi:hypothetical protein
MFWKNSMGIGPYRTSNPEASWADLDRAAKSELRVSVQSRSAVRPFRNSPESSKHHRPLVRSVLEVKPASPSLDRCERDAAQES